MRKLRAGIVVGLGGRAADALIYGEENVDIGISGDLESVNVGAKRFGRLI